LTKRTLEDIKMGNRLRKKTMVARRKITKKTLKKPDEFVTWASQAMTYVLSHIGYIVLGVVLIAAIIVALFLWRQDQAIREEMAFTLLGRGITLYHQEEKREETLPIFSELINDYSRTTAGKIALLYRGRSYMLQKDYDNAIMDFDLFLKRSSRSTLKVIALNALAHAYWAKEEYQKSINYFQQLLDSKDEWLKPYVFFNMGMCWEKLGERNKAIEAYQESLNEELPPPWGTLAKTRLKELGGKEE
jgi:predicted negative regulator of RcsB-dependent stress response